MSFFYLLRYFAFLVLQIGGICLLFHFGNRTAIHLGINFDARIGARRLRKSS